MTKTNTDARFDAMTSPEPNTGCILWTGGVTSGGGYGKFTLDKNGGTILAHRWAWERAHGKIPKGQIVRHLKCDQPSCVNVAHLALGTHADNSRDMTSKGRQARGERCHTAKLQAKDVLAIRAAWAAGGETQKQISERFGVNGPSISHIVTRRTWRHI